MVIWRRENIHQHVTGTAPNYLVWLHQRWQDPAFPLAFPWFNADDYWHRQFQLLSEQAQLLKQTPPVMNSYNC